MSFRILCVTPWFPNNRSDGTNNFIYHSIEALRQQGNAVSVLVARPWIPNIFDYLHPDWIRKPVDLDSFDPDIPIRVRYHLSIPRNYFQSVSTCLFRASLAAEIRRMARELDADIIHIHTETTGAAVVPIAKELGVPSVVTIHGINTAPRLLNTKKKRERLRRALLNADRVVLVGEPLRQYFAPLAGGDSNFRVVPNGFFFPETVARKELFRSRTLEIISVSNLHDGKGIDLNLQALAGLNQRGQRKWRYTIVGGGRERSKLETLTRELGLAGQVEFCGLLPHDQVFTAMADADVFLLPSYREAFGVAYLEAMAAGLVTIGVQRQGPEAFISHGVTGYLVPPHDSGAITDLLCTIMREQGSVSKIADAGRLHVRDNFNWERHAEKLTEIYTELLVR